MWRWLKSLMANGGCVWITLTSTRHAERILIPCQPLIGWSTEQPDIISSISLTHIQDTTKSKWTLVTKKKQPLWWTPTIFIMRLCRSTLRMSVPHINDWWTTLTCVRSKGSFSGFTQASYASKSRQVCVQCGRREIPRVYAHPSGHRSQSWEVQSHCRDA